MKILCLISLAIVVSCSTVKKTSNTEPVHGKTTAAEIVSPQILTLVFKITKGDSVYLTDILLSPGVLKESIYPENSNGIGDLSLSLFNDSNTGCRTIIIPDPLKKRVEFSDDNINIKSKSLDLENANFSLRVQYETCMRQISVSRIVDPSSGIYKKLAELPINLKNYEEENL